MLGDLSIAAHVNRFNVVYGEPRFSATHTHNDEMVAMYRYVICTRNESTNEVGLSLARTGRFYCIELSRQYVWGIFALQVGEDA